MATLQATLQQIENTLGVYGRYLYTTLGIKQTTYSAWKTGRNKTGNIHLYEQFKAVFGIDLYQSMQRDMIIVSDASKLSDEHYSILVTNGPVEIKTNGD